MANVVQPEVYTLGVSDVDWDTMKKLGLETPLDTEPVEDLVEFAGRSCYQSFHRKAVLVQRHTTPLLRTLIRLSSATASLWIT